MIPQELRTERLLLRQWRDGDAEALGEIYSQPEFLEHDLVHDLATEGGRARVECWREHLAGAADRDHGAREPPLARGHGAPGAQPRGKATWHGHEVVWYAVDR